MSNIVDAFFIQYREYAVNLQIFDRYRITKGVKKQGLTRDFDVFIYCGKSIYKSIKIEG